MLGPRDRSGPPSRPADPAAADAGVTLHTDPRSDRTNRQHPPRHFDLPSGGVRHRDAGERNQLPLSPESLITETLHLLKPIFLTVLSGVYIHINVIPLSEGKISAVKFPRRVYMLKAI